MASFDISAEAMSMAEFAEIVADHGWTSRPARPGEVEQETDTVFENGSRHFVAWVEGGRIGANRYPRDDLETVVFFYPEGSVGYRRMAGT